MPHFIRKSEGFTFTKPIKRGNNPRLFNHYFPICKLPKYRFVDHISLQFINNNHAFQPIKQKSAQANRIDLCGLFV